MRSSFVFYNSWWEAIKNLPRDVQGDVLTAIVEYGLTGVTTGQLEPITKAMLAMAKIQIDINNQRFENGKKGGRKKSTSNQIQTKVEPNTNQNVTKSKPSPNQNQTKLEPNLNQGCGLVSGEKENEKDVSDGFPLQPFSLTSEKDKEKEKKESTPYGVLKKKAADAPFSLPLPMENLSGDTEEKPNPDLTNSENTPPPGSAPPPSPKRFVKPSVDEVRAYCTERRNGVDAQIWWDFYESKGWMVGSNHMKDWKAAVRTWEKRDNHTNSYGRKEQRQFGNTRPGDFAGKGYTDI